MIPINLPLSTAGTASLQESRQRVGEALLGDCKQDGLAPKSTRNGWYKP